MKTNEESKYHHAKYGNTFYESVHFTYVTIKAFSSDNVRVLSSSSNFSMLGYMVLTFSHTLSIVSNQLMPVAYSIYRTTES